MSAETFTTAMFLITAVIAAAVLINAVFPIVYNMAETFSSSSHAADVRLRTDFTIVNTFAFSGNNPQTIQVWMKNIGTEPISLAEINQSDVYAGVSGNVGLLQLGGVGTPYTNNGITQSSTPASGYWQAYLSDLNNNKLWDPGETLQVTAVLPSTNSLSSGTQVYFQYVLPNGIARSIQFNAS